LRAAGFAFTAGYTTTNRTGIAVARRAALDGDSVALAPWDTPRTVARAFHRWRPRALFLIETELWPRLVFDAACRGVPVFSVSARIYPRDERRYRMVRPFIAPTVRRVSLILAQNETERARFLRLGAVPERCLVTGDLKHAAIRSDAQSTALRADLGLDTLDPLVVCGSVHADEIPMLVAALARLNDNVRYIVAPRHDGAVAPLLAAARRQGWPVRRRSDGPSLPRWRLMVWDSYGELCDAYAIATVAVVGGTFRPHGGHNLLEPVSAGAPVVFGAYTDHWTEAARRLSLVTPDARVVHADDLAPVLARWLSDAGSRAAALQRQRSVLPDGAAIANHYVAVLSPWLREVGLERA
jgi:3-deoxy-D-manno-octulosonic-acid transferase